MSGGSFAAWITASPSYMGLAFGLSLIAAIGAQNLYVLRVGIARSHAFTVAGVCALVDALLIVVGVTGVGAIIASNPTLAKAAAWAGAAFLAWYGALAFRDAIRGHGAERLAAAREASRKSAIIQSLAFSLLNPHVYLDTVVLLGGVGAQFSDVDRPWFAGGAILASFLWFFGIAYGARTLAPWLTRGWGPRALDLFVAATMWLLAAYLISGALS